MNWLLIVVLAIIIVNAWIGRKKGFVKVVFSMISLILAMVLTLIFSPTVTGLLRDNENVYGSITEKVEKVIYSDEEEVESSDEDSFIEGLILPSSIKEKLTENKEKGINNIKAYVTEYITEIVLKAIGFIVTFVLLLIAIWIISIALNLISKLPVLNQINKTAGLVAGLVHGLVLVWILFIFLTIFAGTGFGQSAFAAIESSSILSFLYDNNFLTKYVINISAFISK